MRINLRFGLQRDKEIIRNLSDKLDGLVIPAHILAYQSDVTATFMASFLDMPFIIDPMTYLLQHTRNDLTNDQGHIRASISKLCNAYEFSEIDDILSEQSELNPDDVPDAEDFCDIVYDYQMSIEERATTKKAVKKYLSRYGMGDSITPRLVVSPYFRFRSTSDVWYDKSLEMAIAMQQTCLEKEDDLLSAPVIFLSVDSLTQAHINKIADDYQNFEHIILWLQDFNETNIRSEAIINARKLVSALSSSKIEMLYSGYLLMTTAAEGTDAISHGLTYSQHKSFDRTPGGGGLPERYYIPKFKAFRSLSQTDIILHACPDLICNCETCQELLDGDPDRIVLFADEPELLREHFINVRQEEAQSMENFDRQAIVEDLDETYGSYHNLIRNLPNPDAFASGSNMSGLQYLQRWSEGIGTEIQ